MKRKSYGSVKEMKLLLYTTILVIIFMIIIPIMSIGIKFNFKQDRDMRVNENYEKPIENKDDESIKDDVNNGVEENTIDKKIEEIAPVVSNDIIQEVYVAGDEKVKVYRTLQNKIDEIDLEDYICGVIANEMQVSFEEEALKAQALSLIHI